MRISDWSSDVCSSDLAALDQMNGLSGQVAKNVAFSAYLLQSIRAAGTAPDAVDEDRRQLQILEGATAQTSASLDQLLDARKQERSAERREGKTSGSQCRHRWSRTN